MAMVIPVGKHNSTQLECHSALTALAARLRNADESPPYGSRLEASRRPKKRLLAVDSNYYAR